MQIIMTDGSILTCDTIEIMGDALYCDEIYTVDMSEVDRIESI